MMSNTRKCCTRPSKYHIIYDAGIVEQVLTLCSFHYELDPVFRKNIKSIVEVFD